MIIAADLHVHVYLEYDINLFFETAFKRLSEAKEKYGELLGVIALTEREDCHFYEAFSRKIITLDSRFLVESRNDCVEVSCDNFSLLVFPGFQFNTEERIEMLGLLSEARVSSGLSLKHSLASLEESAALPVINWAPGKWLFERGALIKNLIATYRKELFLCDTSLRPRLYPTPLRMRQGKRKGIKVLYGSDPLPHERESNVVFSYYTLFKVDSFNKGNAREELAEILRTQQGKAQGKRNSLFQLLKRRKY